MNTAQEHLWQSFQSQNYLAQQPTEEMGRGLYQSDNVIPDKLVSTLIDKNFT